MEGNMMNTGQNIDIDWGHVEPGNNGTHILRSPMLIRSPTFSTLGGYVQLSARVNVPLTLLNNIHTQHRWVYGPARHFANFVYALYRHQPTAPDFETTLRLWCKRFGESSDAGKRLLTHVTPQNTGWAIFECLHVAVRHLIFMQRVYGVHLCQYPRLSHWPVNL